MRRVSAASKAASLIRPPVSDNAGLAGAVGRYLFGRLPQGPPILAKEHSAAEQETEIGGEGRPRGGSNEAEKDQVAAQQRRPATESSYTNGEARQLRNPSLSKKGTPPRDYSGVRRLDWEHRLLSHANEFAFSGGA